MNPSGQSDCQSSFDDNFDNYNSKMWCVSYLWKNNNELCHISIWYFGLESVYSKLSLRDDHIFYEVYKKILELTEKRQKWS